MDDKIIDPIARWLLHGGAQIAVGPEAGGVAGWLDEAGTPAFAYTEITGYYLTCLAFMREIGVSDPAVSANAKRALGWLHTKFCGNETPLTRYYSDPEIADWRNDAMFSFDLAMVFRGLAGIEGLVDAGSVDEHLRRETIRAVERQLQKCISSDGHILPYDGGAAPRIPSRWSTRSGPFQLKTAAVLLHSGQTLREDLKEASIRTYETWRAPFVVRSGEIHAALYAIEGLIFPALNGHCDAWTAALAQYTRCLARHTSARSDVVAQLLRAGCVLRREGLLGGLVWESTLEALAAAITNFVGEDGQVFYRARATSLIQHINSWSAMFVFQALTYHMRSSGCTDRLVASLLSGDRSSRRGDGGDHVRPANFRARASETVDTRNGVAPDRIDLP